MAELIIAGDAGYSNVPVGDIGAPPDYSQMQGIAIECDWTGTLSDPVTIWKSGNAYIKCAYYVDTHGGQNYRLEVNPLPHWTPSTPTPFYFDYGNIHDVYIGGCLTGTNGIVFLSSDGTFPTTDYLFYGARIDLEAQLVEDREWDETPAEDDNDLNNENPRGGEYADLANFTDTEQMPEGEMPDVSRITPNYHGLVTCYMVHGGQMEKLANALFMPNFWQSLANKFSGLSDPLTMILDAYELPLELPVDSAIFKLGGIEVPDPDTGYPFALPKNASRYRKYNMGTVTLKEVFGSAKDYTDCSISIFLPYVGVKEIDTDIVMRNALTLYVYIDSWNGDLLYLLHTSNTSADKKYYTQESVVYRWAGNCGKKIPLGRVDNSNQIIQAVSGLASIGMGAISGGAAGAAAFGMPVASNWVNGGFKPIVQTSGGVSGNAGRMDYQYAYLIIKRGVPEYPNNWRAEIGAPQYQTYTVSDLTGTGYTLFSHLQLGNMGNATEEEKAELERLLTTEGVIL